MEWKTIFHQRINELWERAKDRDYRTTQGEYAGRLGVSIGSFRGWIDGKGEPNSEGFVRIAQIENVTLDWLLGGGNEKPTKTIKNESDFHAQYDAISKKGKAVVNATLEAVWNQETSY